MKQHHKIPPPLWVSHINPQTYHILAIPLRRVWLSILRPGHLKKSNLGVFVLTPARRKHPRLGFVDFLIIQILDQAHKDFKNWSPTCWPLRYLSKLHFCTSTVPKVTLHVRYWCLMPTISCTLQKRQHGRNPLFQGSRRCIPHMCSIAILHCTAKQLMPRCSTYLLHAPEK